MEYRIGTLVTRKSHNHDTVFKIEQIRGNEAILKGVNMRLYADADLSDLSEYKEPEEEVKRDDATFIDKIKNFFSGDRNEYFYLPGKVLHIDTDTQLSNKASNPYKIRKNTNFKKYKKSQKKQKISNFS